MTRGLQERDEARQRRARALAEQAIKQNRVWVRRLGIAPSDPLAREQWIEAVTAAAAYRERWNIDDDHRPLGSKVAARTIEAINQRNLAQAAVNMPRGLPTRRECNTPSWWPSLTISAGPEDRSSNR